MSEINSKPIKLTKKGLPDKRAESSKKNLEKGKSIIKQALEKIKETKPEVKPKLPVVYSSDEYSTDEEEIILTEIKKESDIKINVEPVRKETQDLTEEGTKSGAEHYTFTFEKKLDEKIKSLNDDYTKKLSLIENDTKLTKAELKIIKEQNQALKKSMTSTFRTHAGTLNEEMYLKF
jgi:hypothetical protein